MNSVWYQAKVSITSFIQGPELKTFDSRAEAVVK